MNAEQLTSYLQDLKQLKSVDEKELMSLVQKHPYCQHLHFLMVKKAQLHFSVNYEKLLHLAATYTTDRPYLYQIMQRDQLMLEQEIAEEDKLFLNKIEESQPSQAQNNDTQLFENEEDELLTLDQLTDSDSNKLLLEASYLSIKNPEIQSNEFDESEFESEFESEIESDHDFDQLMTLSDLMPCDESIVKTQPAIELPNAIESENKIENTIEFQIEAEKIETAFEPQPKSSFSSWLRKFKRLDIAAAENVETSQNSIGEFGKKIEENLNTKVKNKGRKDKKNKNADLIAFAEQSLQVNVDVASETLAELLVEHDRKKQAIHMLEKLMLQIPEKSSYFASKIKTIQ